MTEKPDSSEYESVAVEQRTDYQVDDPDKGGYGKPPKRTQFKKGVSGNPSGRPRKNHVHPSQSHDIRAIFRKVFATEVKANAGGSIYQRNGGRFLAVKS
jgi:hypothetical protein